MDNKNIITLKRLAQSESGTAGMMIDETGWPICCTLEPQQPIIPPTLYNVIPYFSPLHKHDVFLLENVPGREGVEIHIGNYLKDTTGCILVGSEFSYSFKMLLNSADAFNRLWNTYKTIGFILDVRNEG